MNGQPTSFFLGVDYADTLHDASRGRTTLDTMTAYLNEVATALQPIAEGGDVKICIVSSQLPDDVDTHALQVRSRLAAVLQSLATRVEATEANDLSTLGTWARQQQVCPHNVFMLDDKLESGRGKLAALCGDVGGVTLSMALYRALPKQVILYPQYGQPEQIAAFITERIQQAAAPAGTPMVA